MTSSPSPHTSTSPLSSQAAVFQALHAQLESVQTAHREALQSELSTLLHRHALARRRLAAYTAHSSADGHQDSEYLGTPGAIAHMRQQLRSADGDEARLSKLADELRDEKERLTENALAFYACRCEREGLFGGS